MNEATTVWVAVGGCAAAWLFFLYQFDRYEPEPLGTVLKVGLGGGFLSVLVAGLLNSSFDSAMQYESWSQGLMAKDALIMSVFVGLNEEWMKFLAAVLLLRRQKHLDEPVDALIYSTAVALGFAFFENLDYTFQYGFINLAVRQMTAVPLHIGVAVIWGYGIAVARFRKEGGIILTAAPYVMLAAGVHALYDFFCFVLSDDLAPLSLLSSFGIAAGLFWLTVRRMRSLRAQSPFITGAVCEKCGTINPLDATTCTSCSNDIDRSFFKICRQCHVKASASENYCAYCGSELED